MTTPLLHGLPPIIDDGARVLILGNMPSVMSLAAPVLHQSAQRVLADHR
jgi:hypothetical protein